jgi:hypothetical protein
MSTSPPLELEFPVLSADGVALVRRPTVEATAIEIEYRFRGNGRSLYRQVPNLSRSMYSGDLTAEKVLAGLPNTKKNAPLRSVIRAISKYSDGRNVICHRQPLRLLPFRSGFAIAVRVPFVFVENGRAWWWHAQCRGTHRLLAHDLGLVGALIARAYEDLPEYSTAGLELIDCMPPIPGDSDRIGVRRGFDTLPAWSRRDVDHALHIYSEALLLVARKQPDLVQAAVARQKRRLSQPGANPWLF